MSEIGAVAAETGGDRLAAFRMGADGSRQRQQLQRQTEIEAFRRDVLGQRNALRLLALAKLDIGAEAARAQAHRLAGLRVVAEALRPGIRLRALGAEAAGE